MSCYEWEQGTVRIPAAQWSSFRKGLILKWNQMEQEAFGWAQRAYEAIKNEPDALFVWQGPFEKWVESNPDARVHYDRIREALYGLGPTKKENLRRPLKENLKLLPVSKGVTIQMADADITLDDATKMVTWSVDENNHARERARSHPVAKAFFSALREVEWTRGSGGVIVGNDEYNQHSTGVGEGGNYEIDRFGPKSKREK
jgi:hypothetical protein